MLYYYRGLNMLKTDRLILRKFNDDDFEDYYKIVSPFAKDFSDEDKKLKAFKLGNISSDLKTILQDKNYSFLFRLSEIALDRENEMRSFQTILKSNGECAICLDSNKVIGKISLHTPRYYKPDEYSFSTAKEIGVVMNEDFRNKGYMTEAVKGIVKYIMTEKDINAVYARILSSNGASLRLFEKCGFKFLYEKEELVSYSKQPVTTKGITKEQLSPLYDDVNYENI